MSLDPRHQEEQNEGSGVAGARPGPRQCCCDPAGFGTLVQPFVAKWRGGKPSPGWARVRMSAGLRRGPSGGRLAVESSSRLCSLNAVAD